METKILPLIGYGLAGALLAVLSTYYFIYNPEVYDNSRFVESFKLPIENAKNDPPKREALIALQKKGLEWAHYQFVDAIKEQNTELVELYIDAGMALRNKGLIIGQMTENPKAWIVLIERLGWGNREKLSGLFPVPRHLTKLDEVFKTIEKHYVVPHDVAFKNLYLEFKKIHDEWMHEKNLELANVDVMCEGNTRCKIKNVPGILTEYEKKRPVAPEKDLILWQHPHLSLMSAAILLGEKEIIDYLAKQNVTSRLNKMEMSDLTMVVFEVDKKGDISYPEGIQLKKFKQVKIQAVPQTEEHFLLRGDF
ncbi:MAG: hypothetical protein COB62_01315 [Piscirickettsiaceae bacterium]|nr:MAG: hypothetical protein COB62_01315 [Piscirickettsiaceae bacterium]